MYIVNNSSYKIDRNGPTKNYDSVIGSVKGVFTPYNLQNWEKFTYENGYIVTEHFHMKLAKFKKTYNVYKIIKTIFRQDTFFCC